MPDSDPAFILFWCLWFGVLGACIGSFLNVVAYRLPRRKSLVHPPSHCPRCECLIRWHDNIPVIGWIKLWGKCRNCRMPISIRYPCVEAISSILFCGIFILLGQLDDISLAFQVGLTLFFSTLGACAIVLYLIMEQWYWDKL